MVRAWYMDTSDADQRLPHMCDPPEYLSLDMLENECGVHHWTVDVDNLKEDATFQKLRAEKYNYEDTVTVDESVANYDELIKKFFAEHIHDDDEVRLVVDGSGYFDIRDPRDDRWIRIELVKRDMISMPAGCYHRFTLDSKNHIVANRYFAGDPVWTPHHRPQDEHPARVEYLKKIGITA